MLFLKIKVFYSFYKSLMSFLMKKLNINKKQKINCAVNVTFID